MASDSEVTQYTLPRPLVNMVRGKKNGAQVGRSRGLGLPHTEDGSAQCRPNRDTAENTWLEQVWVGMERTWRQKEGKEEDSSS